MDEVPLTDQTVRDNTWQRMFCAGAPLGINGANMIWGPQDISLPPGHPCYQKLVWKMTVGLMLRQAADQYRLMSEAYHRACRDFEKCMGSTCSIDHEIQPVA